MNSIKKVAVVAVLSTLCAPSFAQTQIEEEDFIPEPVALPVVPIVIGIGIGIASNYIYDNYIKESEPEPESPDIEININQKECYGVIIIGC